MIVHVVGLKFVPEMSEADIATHFETEVVLHERMPELVPTRAHWGWSKNNSGPLFPESDRGAALNNGCEYVVTVWLAGREAMLKYGPHPKHVELMELQKDKLTSDGKIVLDPVGLPFKPLEPMVLHVVGLKFVPEMSEADIATHFETEVALHERMPELVPTRAHWGWSKNNSGPLFPESDRGAALNNGCEYVVTVWLAGREAMLKYGPHPKHVELMALQADGKLQADGEDAGPPAACMLRLARPHPRQLSAAQPTHTVLRHVGASIWRVYTGKCVLDPMILPAAGSPGVTTTSTTTTTLSDGSSSTTTTTTTTNKQGA